ncbi:hypothetical protein [Nocardia sp. CA-145437]|uniref:hypothetical protein n=1 Tax=Nocardia sp. CA-145437 TaxID=3239980 RepID=UPI003D956CBD
MTTISPALLPELLPEFPKPISADATPVVAVVAATAVAITARDNRRDRIRMGGNAFHRGERHFRYAEEPEFGVSRLTEAAIYPNQIREIPFIGIFRAPDRAQAKPPSERHVDSRDPLTRPFSMPPIRQATWEDRSVPFGRIMAEPAAES